MGLPVTVAPRVLWLSRHEPTPAQAAALAGCVVTRDARPISNADDVVARFRRGEFDDLVVIAPLTVLRALVERGMRPIYPQMEPATERDGEVRVARGRWVKFAGFRRLNNVAVEFDAGPFRFRGSADPHGKEAPHGQGRSG